MGPAGEQAPLLTALLTALDVFTGDFDVIELSQRLVDACPVVTGGAAAGLLLADDRRDLQLLASTSEESGLLALLETEALDGPSREAFHTGLATSIPDLHVTGHRWREFRARAIDVGYRSTFALPVRCHRRSVGALTVLAQTPAAVDDDGMRAGQALADLAGIGIAQESALAQVDTLPAQLSGAVHARIVIEQAKGVLAERGGLDMPEAFDRLRTHSQKTGRRLADLAAAVVDGTVDLC
ncbi:GAF and ANTAR domain-containing protein [Nocardia alni]|uniref:GAF and ANTAR domain-containing protein n=1 Tax=Nocardia alni TaxID=2815723 RepID=UPI001C21E626|nr:GAF and ANTAR domain-containing protein [Nocardia alni]